MISITVLSYNKPAILDKTLHALVHYTKGPYECIIIDNGSTDPAMDAMYAKYTNSYPQIKVIKTGAGHNPAEGVNAGLKACVNSLIVKMDNDAVIQTDGWDLLLTDFMNKHPEVGMVIPTPQKGINRGDYQEMAWGLGMFYMIRKSVADALGNVVDPVLTHQTECDTCLRVRMHQGYKVAGVQSVGVQHNDVPSPGRDPLEVDKATHRGVIQFLDKWNKYFLGSHAGYDSERKLFWETFPPNQMYMRDLIEMHYPEIWDNKKIERTIINGAEHLLIPTPAQNDYRGEKHACQGFKWVREWAFSDAKMTQAEFCIKKMTEITDAKNGVNPATRKEYTVDIEGFIYTYFSQGSMTRNLVKALAPTVGTRVRPFYFSSADNMHDPEVEKYVGQRHSQNVIRYSRPWYGKGDGNPIFNWSNMVGSNRIGAFFWEYGGQIIKEWIAEANTIEKVLIFGSFLENSLRENGLKNKIVRVQGGVNTAVYNPNGPKHKTLGNGKKCKFLHLGACQDRKGTPILLEAFAKAFGQSDNVSLYIKTVPGWKPVLNSVVGYDVTVDDSMVMDEELAALYRACDFFVFPTKGEGFGMPPLEAFSCGKPVIITDGKDCSATNDYFNKDNCYMIESTRKPVGYLGQNCVCMEPNIDHLVSILRDVYNKGDYMNIAAKTHQHYSLEHMGKEIKEKCLE